MLPKKLTCIVALLFFSLLTQAQIPDSSALQSDDTYYIRTKKSHDYVGNFLFCDRNTLRLKLTPSKIEYFQWAKIDSFGLTTPFVADSLENYDFHVLKTKRGDVFVGKMLSFNGFTVHFLLKTGNSLYLKIAEIKSVSLVNDVILEKADTILPGPDKLFFTPSALLLKKRAREYRNNSLLYNSFDYGATDHINIGGSVSTLVLAGLFTFKIKTGVSLNKYLHIGLGGQVGWGYAIFTEPVSLAMGYGAVTLGTTENYINLGIGKGSFMDSFSSSTTGFTVGTSIRVGKRRRFFAEYIQLYSYSNEQFYFAQFGTSWFKKNNRYDICLTVTSYNQDEGILRTPIFAYTRIF